MGVLVRKHSRLAVIPTSVSVPHLSFGFDPRLCIINCIGLLV